MTFFDPLEELGLLEDNEIELDRAALVMSAMDHTGLDLTPYHDMLDMMQERLAQVGGSAKSIDDQARALRQVYHVENGFTGDTQAYGAPVNADFIRVLERKHGLPVSLCILYVAAARSMGWTAYALNTPGHVLVRLGDEHFVLIDPFNEGLPMGTDQLGQMIRTYMGPHAVIQPEHLAPVPNRAILVRLLRNQASRAEQSGDLDRALVIHERMALVAPEFPDVWWELAQMQIRDADPEGARNSLSAMLEVTRDTDRRKIINDTLKRLSGASGKRDASG